MSKIAPWAAGLALTFACMSAGAGMHQICFEGPPTYQNSTWVPNGIFGCSIDGGTCTITANTPSSMFARSAYPLNSGVKSAGTFKYFDFQNTGGLVVYSAKIEFFDANSVKVGERQCSVSAYGAYLGVPGYATPGAVLTGFSTDASGLVTTGVWKLVSPSVTGWNHVPVQAPYDFVAVGGGAMGVETPVGALIAESNRHVIYAGDFRSWQATTSEAGGASQPHQTTAFVIGMHIEGLTSASLAALLQSATASSHPATAANPSVQATQAAGSGNVILGGGMTATADTSNSYNGLGQFATGNSPVLGNILVCIVQKAPCTSVTGAVGWYAESKDHVISHPGYVDAQTFALPVGITVGGVYYLVVPAVVAATSDVAAHPSIDISGLRGDYALTGIGATVNWHHLFAAGNLLWRLEPRADLGGASVAAKDHIISSPASITGYAIGIKLAQQQSAGVIFK